MASTSNNWRMLRVLGTVMAAVVALGPGVSSALGQMIPRNFEKFRFEIDDAAPPRDQLPPPPKAVPPEQLNTDDLALVPEVHFQEPIVVKTMKDNKKLSNEELAAANRKAMIQIAHQMAKINHLNQIKADFFMETLLAHRPDLAGLPFVMGDACRLKKSERLDFKSEVDLVRGGFTDADLTGGVSRFWRDFDAKRLEKVSSDSKNRFTVASLMQILAPESRECHLMLVWRLPAIGKAAENEVTQALAQLAVFSTVENVRKAALAALQKRETGPATAILLKGLRYPWPSVARNASEAVVHLKRVDLLAELVKMLEEPDPRAPVNRSIIGKKVPVVRELVRIEHHRNCLLCHAPGNTPDVFSFNEPTGSKWSAVEKGVQSMQVKGEPELGREVVVAPVPIPGQPVSSSSYSRTSLPDIIVRADITYLRQDFSLMQKDAGTDGWPEMRRFDYLVRSRVVTEREAQTYRKAFAGQAGHSPYRQAALNALRHLTGKDAAATAEQWRTALGL